MLVNQDDPVKASLVDDRIQALITEANLILAQRISDEAANYLDLIVEGGTFSVPILGDVDILGLDKAAAILEPGRRTSCRRTRPAAEALERVIKFADLAGDNLDFALPLLGAIAEPITRRQAGRRRPVVGARRLRDRRRGDDHADVRHGAPGRRLARARARGERVRADHPRQRRPRPACWSRSSSSA